MTTVTLGLPVTVKEDPTSAVVGESEAARRIREFAKRAAATDQTVLIRGETGVGKDLLAELIHQLGQSEEQFVPVDCGALTESLSESELFGHVKGAFTDAREVKPGLIRVAGRGTLFFNEIANMSLTLQAKFLRILEKRSYRSVGAFQQLPVRARLIAATNADLEAMVRRGELRLDLYHRLNVIVFTIPPLREHREDIPVLARHFLEKDGGRRVFSEEALTAMTNYDWPGNIRELMNAVARASFLVEERDEVMPMHLFNGGAVSGNDAGASRPANLEKPVEPVSFRAMEKEYIRTVLAWCGGNLARAAKIAGLHRNTLQRKVSRYNLEDLARRRRSRFNETVSC